MTRTRRLTLTAFGLTFGLAALLVLGALWALQTSWFRDKVRDTVVSTVEHATGGRVELHSFQYDWHTRTARFDRFVLHGNEPRGAKPFFQAASIRITLRLISLWKRDIDLESITVSRPEVYLVVEADGSNNIPVPRTGALNATQMVSQLLRLKAKRFDFENGILDVNVKQLQLDAHGENMDLVLKYDFAGPQYRVELSSKQLNIASGRFRRVAVDVNVKAQLAKDKLTIEQLTLSSKGSVLDASGTLTKFSHPVAEVSLNARLSAQELADELGVTGLRNGEIGFVGTAHYGGLEDARLRGHVSGQHISFLDSFGLNGFEKFRSFGVQVLDAQSDVLATINGIQLSSFSAHALGSTLTGSATVDKNRLFKLDGILSSLNIRHAVSTLDKPFPWSGVANGPIHLQGHFGPTVDDIVAQTQLDISPISEGIPVSGHLDFSYRKQDGTVRLGESQLSLPNTRASFSGLLGNNLKLAIDSTNLADLDSILLWSSPNQKAYGPLAGLVKAASAHFDGSIDGELSKPHIVGNLQLSDTHIQGLEWNRIRSQIAISSNALDLSSVAIDGRALRAQGDLHLSLVDWQVHPQSSLRLTAKFQGADMSRLVLAFGTVKGTPVNGIAGGTLKINGSLKDPQGSADVAIDSLDAYGEHLNLSRVSATLANNQVRITSGRVQAGPALIEFSGNYRYSPDSWQTGRIEMNMNSNGFPLASLGWFRRFEPGLNAQLEVHGTAAALVKEGTVQPSIANGTATLRSISVNKVNYGNLELTASTKDNLLDTQMSGDLRGSHLNGHAQVQLDSGNSVTGDLHLDRVAISSLIGLVNPGQAASFPVDGYLQAAATFLGPLQNLDQMRGTVRVDQFQVEPKAQIGETKPGDLVFRNIRPIELEASNGVASFRQFEIRGPETLMKVAGSIPYLQGRPFALRMDGTVDLRLLELLEPSLRSSGRSNLAVSVEGTVASPSVNGSLQLRDGSLSSNSFPSGLTAVNGTVSFARDLAIIEQLTAVSGGGRISLGGNVNFRGGGPLVYALKANAQDVRVRYAGGISVTANSDLSLTGTGTSSLVSGNVTVSRIGLNADIDAGSLLAGMAAPSPSPGNQKDFVSGLKLDVHVESAPDLQLSTALSRDVEAEVDLRLRGSPDHPTLLGSISANQGAIRIFGTKYNVNRGQVNFFNPAKIEPVLDLDLQTESRGITVDITVSGSVNKLNINYRSDPPLQPRDIIALLAVGRAPDIASSIPNAQVTNDASALQTGANTVLGQAISPVSNRLSKLFGITNIKIDPLVQGITNTPQARLTLEQQISRDITVTYITNLSQTSEQIFRFEWALNSNYSVIARRDDNGEFGLDLQYKRRFK